MTHAAKFHILHIEQLQAFLNAGKGNAEKIAERISHHREQLRKMGIFAI